MIVQRSCEGETLAVTQVTNDDVAAFAKAVTDAGEHPEVVIEACYGWYWAVDLLEELGCRVHLAHPLGNAWGNRRVKNDLRDAYRTWFEAAQRRRSLLGELEELSLAIIEAELRPLDTSGSKPRAARARKTPATQITPSGPSPLSSGLTLPPRTSIPTP